MWIPNKGKAGRGLAGFIAVAGVVGGAAPPLYPLLPPTPARCSRPLLRAWGCFWNVFMFYSGCSSSPPLLPVITFPNWYKIRNRTEGMFSSFCLDVSTCTGILFITCLVQKFLLSSEHSVSTYLIKYIYNSFEFTSWKCLIVRDNDFEYPCDIFAMHCKSLYLIQCVSLLCIILLTIKVIYFKINDIM